jgi:O-antigen/teichoic acid export membrane protein
MMDMDTKKDSKSNLHKKVSKNSLYTALFNIWYLGTRLALVPFILNYVSIEEYGLWTYCFVILSYIGLAAFGFNTTYIRYAADYRSRNENHKLNELLSTGLISMTLFSAVLFPTLYFLAPDILSLLGVGADLHQVARDLFLGSAVIFMLNFSFSGFQNILEGEQRIDLVRKIQWFASVIEIALLVFFLTKGLGIISLLWAYGIRYLIILCLNIFFAYKTFPHLRVSFSDYRREALSQFLNFGGRLQLIGFLSILNQSIDRIFIAKFLHLEAVGFYEAARKLPNIGMTLPSAVAGSMIPAAAHLQGTNQKAQINNAVLLGTRYLMILSSIPYAALIYFAPLIIETWLGKEFAEIVPVMQILALGTFINLLSGVGTSCLRGTGDTQWETKYMGVSLILLLITAPFALHMFGLVGVASAYCFSQIVGTIYFMVLSNRLFEIARIQFVHRILFPVAVIFLSGVPLFLACHFGFDLSHLSRWEGGGLLLTLISVQVVLALLIFLLFKKKLLLDFEKQKLTTINIAFIKSKLLPKQWKHA